MFKRHPGFVYSQDKAGALDVYAYFVTAQGIRVFGKKAPSEAFLGNVGGAYLHDGAIDYDASIYYGFGSQAILDSGPRLISVSSFSETLTPEQGQLLASLRGVEITTFTVELDNTDGYFSDLLAHDILLGAKVIIKIGYRGTTSFEFIDRVTGRIDQIFLRRDVFRVRAQSLI